MVTEATLRLAGIPTHHLAVTITFKTLEEASRAVAAMIGSGLEPAALELLTPGLIVLMNREKNLALPELPSLFCEFHRITSYNVCYTKLLRLNSPSPSAFMVPRNLLFLS